MKKHKSKPPTSTTTTTPVVKDIPTQVISHTPGRLRLRVGKSDRNQLQDLETRLSAHPQIEQVRTNTSHGSITIHHSLTQFNQEEVMETLKDFGIIVGEIVNIGVGRSAAADGVASAVIDLNRRVKRSTDGELDLRVLFPFALACLSVRQLLIKGLQLEIIPWYVLAWYAFDSFLKLHTSSLSSEQ